MLEHLRHFLIFLGVAFALLSLVRVGSLVGGLRGSRSVTTGSEDRTVAEHDIARSLGLAAVGGGVGYVLAGSPAWAGWPQGWAGPVGAAARWLVAQPVSAAAVACGVYVVIVLVTNTWLIGAPRYRLLQSRIRVLDSAIVTADVARPVGPELRSLVASAQQAAVVRVGALVFAAPLTRLFRATRILNAAEIGLVERLDDQLLQLRAGQIAVRLAATRRAPELSAELHQQLTAPAPVDAAAIRRLATAALITIHAAVDEPAEREAERTRVALWLTLVGLMAVLAVSVAVNRDAILLAGALGGLLGQLAALTRRQKLAPEAIILSPVAGALNAVGGVLLVAFLATDNVDLLGDVVQDVWTSSQSVEALTVALVLGFSGGLFARLAVNGTGYLLAPLGRPEPDADRAQRAEQAERAEREEERHGPEPVVGRAAAVSP